MSRYNRVIASPDRPGLSPLAAELAAHIFWGQLNQLFPIYLEPPTRAMPTHSLSLHHDTTAQPAVTHLYTPRAVQCVAPVCDCGIAVRYFRTPCCDIPDLYYYTFYCT